MTLTAFLARKTYVSLTITAILATPAMSEMLNKGKILNADGEWCWFEQKQIESSDHFSDTLTANIAIMTFDQPNCMKAEPDSADEIVNINQINQMISNWHSHDDANFQSGKDELLEANGLFNVGYCMLSETYGAVGVALDYEIEDSAIVKVYHTGVNPVMCK